MCVPCTHNIKYGVNYFVAPNPRTSTICKLSCSFVNFSICLSIKIFNCHHTSFNLVVVFFNY